MLSSEAFSKETCCASRVEDHTKSFFVVHTITASLGALMKTLLH